MISEMYSYYKKYKYDKPRKKSRPYQEIERKFIDQKERISVKHYHDLEKRVQELEKYTPLRLTIYIGILAIVIAIVLKYLP